MNKSLKTTNIFTISLILILILLLTIITTISAQELTEEEKAFLRLLREKGITIQDGNTQPIGGREFSQNNPNSNGFVQEIRKENQDSYF